MRLATLVASFTLPLVLPAWSQVVVNEVMPGPGTDWNLDGHFSSQDDEWVELYNSGGTAVDLTGWILTDQAGGTGSPRFGFADTLQPGEHRFVTGRMAADWESANGFSSVGLSLNNSGDTVSLFQTAGGNTTLVDSVGWSASSQDVSFGRLPDGSGSWSDFDALTSGGTGPQPTPGGANGGPAEPKILSMSIAPGFPSSQDSVTVQAVCGDEDGISQTLLLLTVDSGAQQQLAMSTVSGSNTYGTWERVIGPYPGGTSLQIAVQTSDGTSTATTSADTIQVQAAGSAIALNEILADPPADAAGDANGDGTRDTSDDEFIEILNWSSQAVDLSGWEIHDGASLRHVFAPGVVVSGGQMIVVFGGGTPTGIASPSTVASSGSLSLNNTGDSVILRDSSGVVQDAHSYGSEANADQSLIRIPDGTGSWTRPADQGIAAPFSPGQPNGAVTSLDARSWGKVKSLYR